MDSPFDAEQWDALQELVNLGMGSAGASLAQALGSFVKLKVPRLELVEPSRMLELLDDGPWKDREFTAVRQLFYGGLMGETLMLFQGLNRQRIADLLGHAGDLDDNGRDEVTLDLANAVIGACLNGIAEPLHEVLSFSPPSLLGQGSAVRKVVAQGVGVWSRILLVDVDLHLEDRRLESRVLMFMTEPTLVRIEASVSRFLASLASS